jgi:hypothetical protein
MLVRAGPVRSPDAGNAEKPTLGRIMSLCISREFTLLAANKASPVTESLRALARLAHEECGGRGVGAIGMCPTGGFASSMALEPVVLAPVLQPGLPATRTARTAFMPAGLAALSGRSVPANAAPKAVRSVWKRDARQIRFQQGFAKEDDHLIHRASCGLVGRPASRAYA